MDIDDLFFKLQIEGISVDVIQKKVLQHLQELKKGNKCYHNLQSLKENWTKFNQFKSGLKYFTEDYQYIYFYIDNLLKHQQITDVKEVYIKMINFKECTENEISKGIKFISYSPLLLIYEKYYVFFPVMSFYQKDVNEKKEWYDRTGDYFIGKTFEDMMLTIPYEKRYIFEKLNK